MGKQSDAAMGEWDMDYKQPSGGQFSLLNPNGTPPPPNPFVDAAKTQYKYGKQALDEQTAANRPNISTPFGQQQWKMGPHGQWEMSTGFSGGLGSAAEGLNQQAGQMSKPMDWNQFGAVGNGDQARNQAINAAYGQASSRLDPMWGQREDQARTRLMNQGLDPNSEAFKNEMGQLSRDRNDAYGSAMNSAIGMGNQAGSQVFQQNMMARQQGISEALRQRGQPLEELRSMQGLLSMPGFQQAGRGEGMPVLQALGLLNQRRGADQGVVGDAIGGVMSLGGAIPSLFGF